MDPHRGVFSCLPILHTTPNGSAASGIRSISSKSKEKKTIWSTEFIIIRDRRSSAVEVFFYPSILSWPAPAKCGSQSACHISAQYESKTHANTHKEDMPAA